MYTWHVHHVPADVAPPPCKCRAGVAAEADHAMVCEKVAKMTQMCHDNLANALRLVVSACSYQSAGFVTGATQVLQRKRRDHHLQHDHVLNIFHLSSLAWCKEICVSTIM